MAYCAVLCFVVLQLLHRGAAAVIQTQPTVSAAVGEDAPLSCQLLETKDVQQVTWQKVLEKTERSICSYSEIFGQTVNPGFQDKVQFTEAGLQNNSIVIRNVTEQDKGCYLCLFNTYPDGALSAGTCLKLYELHGPFVDVRVVPPGSAVSCSATGRPAPTVTLTGPQQKLGFSHYNATSVTNANGTVTVTTTALLSAPSSTQVGCTVSVGSAAPRELLVTVAAPRESSAGGFDPQIIAVLLTAVVLVCVCAAVLVFLCLKKKNQTRDPERNKTPLKRSHDTHVVKTPTTREENETRQRSTGKKSQEDSNSELLKSSSSSAVVKRLFEEKWCF
ncbi:poliovirus receptor-like [Anableps anableps]